MSATIGAGEPVTQERKGNAREADLDRMAAALDAKGELVLPLDGRSMGGLWADAGVVVVSSLRGARPRPGAVVVFRRADQWVAHRLLLRIGARAVTKGDARWTWDSPLVPVSSIVGVVNALVVKGARVQVPRGAPCRALAGLLLALACAPIRAIRASRG